MIFRLSQKLNTKIDAGKIDVLPLDANPYADWSCHLFTADRAQYIIMTNTKSLYSCVMYGRGITNDGQFIERALSTIREFMEDDGQSFAYQKFIAPSSETVTFVLVPLVDEFRSNQIGVFTGSAIILAIAYFTIRWIGAKRPYELMLVGSIWLVLTVAFEVLFGRFVVGLSWERLLADYNLLEGGLLPIGLLFLFFGPMVASKLREKR